MKKQLPLIAAILAILMLFAAGCARTDGTTKPGGQQGTTPPLRFRPGALHLHPLF